MTPATADSWNSRQSFDHQWLVHIQDPVWTRHSETLCVYFWLESVCQFPYTTLSMLIQAPRKQLTILCDKKKLCYCPACYQNMICICSFWLLVTLQAIKCYIEYPGVKATNRYMWCWTLVHCMCWYLWLQESGNHQLPLFCTCDSQVM